MSDRRQRRHRVISAQTCGAILATTNEYGTTTSSCDRCSRVADHDSGEAPPATMEAHIAGRNPRYSASTDPSMK